ncbi:MAG: cupredoxin domain-containing protein [Endomicrobiia bacterium]
MKKMKNRNFVWYFSFIFLLMPIKSFAEEKVFEIRAKKFSYTPNIIKVNKGDTVRIRLISEDVHHGFYLDGYEIKTSAHPGQDGHLTFVANKTGRFSFRCSITCGEFHPYMVGYLVVQPNWRFIISIILVIIFAFIHLYLLMRKKTTDKDKLFGLIDLNFRFEITKFRFIRKLFKSRWFPLIALIFNLAIFVVILLAGFLGGYSAGNYNFGIMIVWILWWVLLMLILVPVFSRMWCMVCPFPLFSDWAQRGRLYGVKIGKLNGLNLKWPKYLRNMWVMNILFLITTFFSGFFTVRPFATFILLEFIILLAFIVGLIFEKRSFCLYICPVSGFQGLYSQFAMSEIRRKDPDICKKHTPKTCFVGNENGYGCPWLLLPFDFKKNTYCGMCLECFKSCPYDNMAFNLRPAGVDLLVEEKRGLDESWKSFIMLGIAINFFITMQGPWGKLKDMVRAATVKDYLTFISFHSIFSLLVIPAVFFIFCFISKIFSKNKDISLKKIFINFSYTLVPLGLGVWIAFSLGILLPNGSYILHILSDPFAWGWNLFGTANFPWTPIFTYIMGYLQAVAVLIFYLFSIAYGFRLSKQTYNELNQAKRGWLPILCFLTCITITFLWLYLG